jgi:hypothetical protein
MSHLSPRNSSSPDSSNEDHERSSPPPPITIPPEIRIFQKENGSLEKDAHNNNNNDHISQIDLHQTPTLNNKKSFCIDALLAKTQNDSEIIKRTQNQFVNNNYKDNVISRELNSSPDDNLSR